MPFRTTMSHSVYSSKMLRGLLTLSCVLLGAATASAEVWPHQRTPPVDSKDVPFARKVDPEIDRQMRSLEWRCVGPFVGVRGCGVEMHPTDRNVFYHAHSSGGVWKTVNSGTTWTPIFDNYASYSIGCVTIDPKNSNRVWVGTGEGNPRNSMNLGMGIFKSIDGGRNWYGYRRTLISQRSTYKETESQAKSVVKFEQWLMYKMLKHVQLSCRLGQLGCRFVN